MLPTARFTTVHSLNQKFRSAFIQSTLGRSSLRRWIQLSVGVALLTSVATQAHTQANNTATLIPETYQCETHEGDLTRAPAPASADELFVEEEGYDTELDAVISASNYFNPLSVQEDREYIGAILRHRRQGHFIYTVSSGESGEDQVTARIKIPSDYEITAFWHTHGNHHWTRKYFSDLDTQLAKRWNLPLYMADATGRLRVFNPDDRTLSSTQSRKLGLGANRGYAKGKTVAVNNRRVKLATRMDEWLAMHQAPAADETERLAMEQQQACDNWVKHSQPEQPHDRS